MIYIYLFSNYPSAAPARVINLPGRVYHVNTLNFDVMGHMILLVIRRNCKVLTSHDVSMLSK